MKAISLWQPWASLCVTRQPCETCDGREPWDCVLPQHRNGTPMVKRFETRSWPCPPKLIGSRIAVQATAKRPKDVWCHFSEDPEFPPELEPFHGTGRYSDPQESSDGEWWRYRWAGPLGAIVGSAVIKACLPITTERGPYCTQVHIESQDDRLVHYGRQETPFGDFTVDISDQIPYGDFAPGRYAWLLTDAAPTTERCPACGGEGREVASLSGAYIEWRSCRHCDGAGRCDPIPAKGAQRIWNWQP